jgi:hypothetical protein
MGEVASMGRTGTDFERIQSIFAREIFEFEIERTDVISFLLWIFQLKFSVQDTVCRKFFQRDVHPSKKVIPTELIVVPGFELNHGEGVLNLTIADRGTHTWIGYLDIEM